MTARANTAEEATGHLTETVEKRGDIPAARTFKTEADFIN